MPRAAKRRLIVDIVLLVCGLVGLTALVMAARHPVLKGVAIGLILYQGFWYLVRIYLMVGIWRRETALTTGRKLWVAITMPIVALFAVWAGRGKLSQWMSDQEPTDDAE
ncbi:MAG TPA: hypothetical protein DCZ72_04955 [Armatimonadetes bacterium]|nr:hypothetical protein [Armatimonadota bacterium]